VGKVQGLILALLVCSVSLGHAEQLDAEGPPRTLVLGAFDAEIEAIRGLLSAPHDTVCAGVPVTLGILNDLPVAVGLCGIGKVNAAVVTALLIEHLRPRALLFTGIAGGLNPDLEPGDIVIGAQVTHHDVVRISSSGPQSMATRHPVTGKQNPVFFPADSTLLALVQRALARARFSSVPLVAGEHLPRTVLGTIATGDEFIASNAEKEKLRERTHADAVEMEGAAVAQICYQMGTPCLIIRSLSDRADSSAVRDAERFYRIAASNGAALVLAMLQEVAATADTTEIGR